MIKRTTIIFKHKLKYIQRLTNDYATGTYPSYFDNIGGSGSGLPDY